MIKLFHKSVFQVVGTKSFDFGFRFLNLFFLSRLFGEIFIGAYIFIFSIIAFSQTLGSIFDSTTLRFYNSFNIREKYSWFIFSFLFKTIIFSIIFLLVYHLIEYKLIYKEYFISLSLSSEIIFTLLLIPFFEVVFSYLQLILLSSKNIIFYFHPQFCIISQNF